MSYRSGNASWGEVFTPFVRAIGEWLSAVCLVTTMILTGYCSAQNSSGDSGQTEPSQESVSDESVLPLPPSLDSDQPLQVVMSPLHWGRLSLLSLTTYQGYDSNPDLQKMPVASEFFSVSGLVVYSIRQPGWELDLQYQPSVFVSPKTTAKNFTGNLADFQAARRVSSLWNFSADEHFRYSPDVQSSIQGNSLAVNLGGGISILTPFLSSRQSLLLNTISGSLTGRLSEHLNLSFTADESLIRLSSVIGNDLVEEAPAQSANVYSAGFSLSRLLSPKDTINLTYNFRLQSSSNTALGTTNYETANLGWSHVLRPSLRFSLSGGPGWSTSGGQATLQGSCELSKQVRSGGVALSFGRSDDFIGVISDSFNNHYALRFDHHFGTRFNVAVIGSYLQQEFSRTRNQTGEYGSLEVSYLMSRNWSVFGQVRYLASHGNELSFPAQKLATFGIRWSWVPEKP